MYINKRGDLMGYPIKQPLSVISSIKSIMLRIKYANPESPIAVFLHDRTIGLVAVFGSTVKTKKLAIPQNRSFVGIYDKNSVLKLVNVALLSAEATQRISHD